MKDVRDNAFSFLDDWYGRLDDIIEDLKNNGFTVLNATNEFIDVSDENDKEYVLKLGGTEKTITINKIEALDESLIPIQEYYDEDLEESAKVTNESNKELARIAFEDILKPFNGTDIKYTDETEDAEFKTHSYVANIISTPQYVELIKKLIDSDKYEYDPDFNDYVKYTEYGQITIIIEDKYITIEVMYNNDEDYFDENLILIKESAFDNDFILDIVKMGYETGYQIFDSYEDFIEDEEVQDIEDKEAAWDFYCDLIDMGPAGFYEEYRDELDFDPDFIAEYGNDEDLEESAKVTNESNLDSLSNVSEGNSSDSKTIEIVTEKDTFGDYKENVFTALDNIDALISSYQEVNKDSLKELIAALEEELDIIQKIYMKLATGIEQEIL